MDIFKTGSAVIVATAMALVPALGIAQSKSVQFPTNWRVDEKHNIELIKTRVRHDRNYSTTARTRIELEVLRKSADGYVFRWTYGKTRITGLPPQGAELAMKFGNLTENLRLDIKMSADGSIERLLNVAEVTSRFHAAVNSLRQWLAQRGVPEGALNQARRMVAGYLDPKTAEESALVEPSIFLFVIGNEFRLGERLAYDEALPNRFGGRPFPGKANYQLRNIDRARHLAIVDWSKVVDRKRAGPILVESISALMKRVNGTVPANAGNRLKNLANNLVLEERAQFVMDTNSGWPVAVMHQFSMSTGPKTGGYERREFRMRPVR